MPHKFGKFKSSLLKVCVKIVSLTKFLQKNSWSDYYSSSTPLWDCFFGKPIILTEFFWTSILRSAAPIDVQCSSQETWILCQTNFIVFSNNFLRHLFSWYLLYRVSIWNTLQSNLSPYRWFCFKDGKQNNLKFPTFFGVPSAIVSEDCLKTVANASRFIPT